MLRDIVLPAFGSSTGEAAVVQWLVSPGSEVGAGQVIAEIETDKAVAELEAAEAGVIHSIEVAAGSENIEVGTVLARLRVAGTENASSRERPATRPADEILERVKASPYARKLAHENAIDLQGIPGTGPNHRVVSRDLPTIPDAGVVQSFSSLEELGYARDTYTLTPLHKMRRAIAEGLRRSVQDIPQYSLTVDLEFDAVLDHRKSVNAELPDDAGRISINDYVLRACAQALRDVPAANSSWTEEGIAQHHHANIAVAIAIATPVGDGLVAPVIHAAESMTLIDLAAKTRDLIRRARDRQLNPGDLQGATFSVSNLGMLGIHSFNSILSQPQACILSVGAIEARPIVRHGAITIARQATCTLTCDHRVVDGAIGAHFLQQLGERLRSPGA